MKIDRIRHSETAKPQPASRRDAGTAGAALQADLGTRLKRLRKARGWTLQDLGARAGIARSTISKIENGQMSPTFEVLQKLSQGFELDLTELIGGEKTEPPTGRRCITRRGEGEPVAGDNFLHEMLCAEITDKKILPFLSRVSARDISDYEDWHRHEGEDFIYVLEGSCTVHTEFYAPAVLEAGDSIFFDSRMGHMAVSNGQTDALVLWVCTN